jgi:hypothetical protein
MSFQAKLEGQQSRQTVQSGPARRASSLHRSSLVALALSAGVGCGEEATVIPSNGSNGDAAGGPLYLIATTFSAGDQDETYLVTSPTFDATTTIDSTRGPKLIGGVVPTVFGGAVYAPDSQGPVIRRFDLDADDQLQPGPELSFAGVGMTTVLSWHVYIVNETKGYVFDPGGARLIVWNPSTMTLTGAQIDLQAAVREGWSPNLVFEHSGPVRRDSTLLIPLGWTDIDGNSRYASGVLALDTATDEVLSLDEDERCGETYANVVAPNGDAYFLPPDWSAAPHFFADLHQPTCVLRVRAGQTTFDDGPPLDLSALGSGLAAAAGVPDGNSGFFFNAVDEALWDGGNNEGGAVWRVWHYDFETAASRLVETLPTWSGTLYYVNVGGDFFIPHSQPTATGEQTTLYGVGTGGTDPTPVFSFEGDWFGLARLR